MCTVSWMQSRTGFELFFNRDEQLDRAAELPPRLLEEGGTRLVAALDGEAGGTWLWVNEHGVCVGLLNAYSPATNPLAGSRSRGLLALDLASCASLMQLHARLEVAELAPYEPFRMIGLAPGKDPILLDWDGRELRVDSNASGQLPLASSGIDSVQAARERRALLEILVGTGSLRRELLLEFHRSHGAGADAFSPCMHREEAETRSLCHVVVGQESVQLAHAAGSPCTTELGEPVTLERAKGRA